MKKIRFSSLFAVFLLTLAISSCDPENDQTAAPTSNDAREKFHGNWAVAENSKDYGSATYYCTIVDSSLAPYISIAYLYGFNKKIYSSVSASSIVIPTQTVEGNNVSGNATLINDTKINLIYYVQTTTSHFDTVTAVLTK